MRKILKVTSILGIATVIKILAGAIRAEFLAWQIVRMAWVLQGGSSVAAGLKEVFCTA